MLNTKKQVLFSLMACSLFTFCAAQAKPSINERQYNQEKRIEQGERSGQLNNNEARRLEKNQDRIENKEEAFRADGKMTKGERKNLNRSLNRQNKKIHAMKHDKN